MDNHARIGSTILKVAIVKYGDPNPYRVILVLDGKQAANNNVVMLSGTAFYVTPSQG